MHKRRFENIFKIFVVIGKCIDYDEKIIRWVRRDRAISSG